MVEEGERRACPLIQPWARARSRAWAGDSVVGGVEVAEEVVVVVEWGWDLDRVSQIPVEVEACVVSHDEKAVALGKSISGRSEGPAAFGVGFGLGGAVAVGLEGFETRVVVDFGFDAGLLILLAAPAELMSGDVEVSETLGLEDCRSRCDWRVDGAIVVRPRETAVLVSRDDEEKMLW